ncbi:MAG: DNA recombination protein RmuC [Verrucomicrobiota bacterium]|nr:DNA recombination protein RmuC [Verrucomicrobiota bacterium]MEC8657661.1 DNA recombination protein RmuC [Verrucomicrobiota bacterium]
MDLIIGLVIGILLGAGVVYFLISTNHGKTKQKLAGVEAKYEAELKAADDKLKILEEARDSLKDSFKALSADALSKNNESFIKLAEENLKKHQQSAKDDLEKRQQAITKTVEPVSQTLKAFSDRVNKIEERRIESEGGIKKELQKLSEMHLRLDQSTSSLVQALRAPQVRGQWGEMHLRRTVEMAGMINYCDFEEQSSVETEEGQRQRPDMLIRLPNERRVVVDSKVPIAAYLDALETDSIEVQSERMQAHARHLRTHIKDLSTKAYWSQFENAPEFVVLFVPNEAIFSAALEEDPSLIELGVENKVILATPTTLIALLKAVAYGWQQEAITREAKEIASLGKEIYDRLSVVIGHFVKLGKSIDQSVGNYNKAMNSVDSRLMVTARKFESLESASSEQLPDINQIEKRPNLPDNDNE